MSQEEIDELCKRWYARKKEVMPNAKE